MRLGLWHELMAPRVLHFSAFIISHFSCRASEYVYIHPIRSLDICEQQTTLCTSGCEDYWSRAYCGHMLVNYISL